jgi:hypothetical protein
MRNLLNARLILVLGAAVFIVAKAYFIIAQTAAMGMPRLGDDAYVHLWRAEQVNHVGVIGTLTGKFDSGSRAVRDIARICEGSEKAPPSLSRRHCARVADNTVVPDVKAGASVQLNLVLKTGLPLKWVYAINETIIATVIGGGIALFLVKLFGPASAGVALFFMAFLTLLPPQGLRQFIPSTLTIGISIGLLGIVAASKSWRTYAIVALGFAMLSLVHPVAIVFAGALVPLALFTFAPWRHPKAALAAIGAAILGVAAIVAASATVRDTLLAAVSTNFGQNLSENIQALPNRLSSFSIQNWPIVAAFVVSLFWFRRCADRKIIAVGVSLLCLLLASLLHKTNFFLFDIPLDLFARIFVAFAVLGCGFLAKVLVEVFWSPPVWRKAAVAAGILVLVIPSAISWNDNFFSNINGRPEVINDRRLKEIVAAIPGDATLAYGELDITPNAAFMAGADSRGAIPMAGMAPEYLARVLDERRPGLLVLPNYRPLNVLAAAGARTLETRRHGIPASIVDIVAVSLSGGTIASIHLDVENSGDIPAIIGPFLCISAKGQLRLQNVVIGPRERKWIDVDTSFLPSTYSVVFEMRKSALWIRGVSVNKPARSGVNWPWDSAAVVRWHFRGFAENQVAAVSFSPEQLLKHWGTPVPPGSELTAGLRVQSDDSGLVFLTTGYVPAQ